MATNEGFGFAGMSGAQRGAAATGAACEAHDLKRILHHIADQIADADRRHSDALGAMQDRLMQLGSEASGMRARVPLELTPTLDRIEDSMAELADKITAEAEQRRAGTIDVRAAPANVADDLPPLHLPNPAVFADHTRAEPVAAKAPIDPFEMVGLDEPAHDGNPWDARSAEALTRLYETGEAAAEAAATAPAAHVQPAQVAAAPAPQATLPATAAIMAFASSQMAAQPAQPTTLKLDPDEVAREHRWLDDRFADIAARLEHSLGTLRPDGSVVELGDRFTRLEETIGAMRLDGSVIELGDRFTRFEQRVGDALADTVRRADLGGLGSIESKVGDLAGRLDAVQQHFDRLSVIEAELKTLGERVSTENLAKLVALGASAVPSADLMASAVATGMKNELPRIERALEQIAARMSDERLAKLVGGPAAGAPDADAIARVVTEHLAARMPHGDATDSRERLEELRNLVHSLLTEQRHGDEQTTTMLDTMQQAMIRMLDRMETLETAAVAQYEHSTADATDTFGPSHVADKFDPGIAPAMARATTRRAAACRADGLCAAAAAPASRAAAA